MRLLILCITRVTDPAITLFLGDAVKSSSDYRHGIIQYLQDWVMLFEVTLDVTEGYSLLWEEGRGGISLLHQKYQPQPGHCV